MTTYKISKGNWAGYELFNSLEEAQIFTLSNLGSDYIVEVSTDIKVEPLSKEEKFKMDKSFGAQLIELFLLDNRLIEPPVTTMESLALLEKFEKIEKLARLGDCRSIYYLIQNIETDDRIFTEERKNKYIQMIFNQINIRY
jgi:hypothetical protein